jgi:F-type H+-transporting ATPase subunit b
MNMNLLLLATEAAEGHGFGINTDIFETNVVNLLIVLALLVYAGRGFIGNILSSRLKTIESALNEAEQRQQEAAGLLAKQQESLAQAQAEAVRIRQQAEVDAQKAGDAILATIDEDIAKLRTAADAEIATEQERIILQLRQQVAQKALTKVNQYFDQGLSDDVQRELVERSIAMLSAK